ncbi:glpF6 [Symbiodinium pilosum]|uniref:GlpF6 protein n=1 Tax=Symbiodinium pilosum TaxID=2952 RepID=A0A812NF73_SYMPI|nr:glpF6 [Symbiodinium pilosum]
MKPLTFAALSAEFVGTFVVAFTVGCTTLSGILLDWASVSIACASMVMMYAFAPVSGGHLNPSISISMFLAGKLRGITTCAYIVAQATAAILALLAVRQLFSEAPAIIPKAGSGWTQACLVEMIYTAMLNFVVLCVYSRRNNPDQEPNQFYGIACGFALIAGIGATQMSGGVFNPAVTMGVGVVTKDGGCLMYLCYQLLASLIASMIFRMLRPEEYIDIASFQNYEPSDGIKYGSEFVGTFLVVITYGLSGVRAMPETFSWTTASALMSLVYAVGDLSGGHFNPAVTTAVVLSRTRRFSVTQLLTYWAVQVAAGLLAILACMGLFPSGSWNLAPQEKYTAAGAYIVEFTFTMLICITFLSVSCVKGITSGFQRNFYFGLAIGFSVLAGGVCLKAWWRWVALGEPVLVYVDTEVQPLANETPRQVDLTKDIGEETKRTAQKLLAVDATRVNQQKPGTAQEPGETARMWNGVIAAVLARASCQTYSAAPVRSSTNCARGYAICSYGLSCPADFALECQSIGCEATEKVCTDVGANFRPSEWNGHCEDWPEDVDIRYECCECVGAQPAPEILTPTSSGRVCYRSSSDCPISLSSNCCKHELTCPEGYELSSARPLCGETTCDRLGSAYAASELIYLSEPCTSIFPKDQTLCKTCEKMSSRGVSSSQEPSTSTAPTTSVGWEHIGDAGKSVCRGRTSHDNSPSYYEVQEGITELQACQSKCVEQLPSCKGIEFSYGRCEIWTRPHGIFSWTMPSSGSFTCMRYGWPTQNLLPVDGGEGRACRGDHPADNNEKFYNVIAAETLDVMQDWQVPVLSDVLQKQCLAVAFIPAHRPMSCRIFLVRHGERADGPGLPPPPEDGWLGDAPLTGAGRLQAKCTAALLKSMIGPLRTAVVSSPARRCLQTARPIADALQAELCVEPGLADWGGLFEAPPLELGMLGFGPVWAKSLEEETWEMAAQRYLETYRGLATNSAALDALVLCSHPAALEALVPAAWTQGHCAITELSGLTPTPGEQLHDTSAWRQRFMYVVSREPRKRYWRAKGTPTSTRLFPWPADFWSVAVANMNEAGLTLTTSKRDRPSLLFFLDMTGKLVHLLSGLTVSADENAELTLGAADVALCWKLGSQGELLNEKGAHVSVHACEVPSLRLQEKAGRETMAFDLVPLGGTAPCRTQLLNQGGVPLMDELVHGQAE